MGCGYVNEPIRLLLALLIFPSYVDNCHSHSLFIPVWSDWSLIPGRDSTLYLKSFNFETITGKAWKGTCRSSSSLSAHPPTQPHSLTNCKYFERKYNYVGLHMGILNCKVGIASLNIQIGHCSIRFQFIYRSSQFLHVQPRQIKIQDPSAINSCCILIYLVLHSLSEWRCCLLLFPHSFDILCYYSS